MHWVVSSHASGEVMLTPKAEDEREIATEREREREQGTSGLGTAISKTQSQETA